MLETGLFAWCVGVVFGPGLFRLSVVIGLLLSVSGMVYCVVFGM